MHPFLTAVLDPVIKVRFGRTNSIRFGIDILTAGNAWPNIFVDADNVNCTRNFCTNI